MVRHQPSKLTFAGSNPVSRSWAVGEILPAVAFSGPIAQWLEQAAHNRSVAGSNPAGPTPDSPAFAGLLCFWWATPPGVRDGLH